MPKLLSHSRLLRLLKVAVALLKRIRTAFYLGSAAASIFKLEKVMAGYLDVPGIPALYFEERQSKSRPQNNEVGGQAVDRWLVPNDVFVRQASERAKQ